MGAMVSNQPRIIAKYSQPDDLALGNKLGYTVVAKECPQLQVSTALGL
jgi:hypothetical protein